VGSCRVGEERACQGCGQSPRDPRRNRDVAAGRVQNRCESSRLDKPGLAATVTATDGRQYADTRPQTHAAAVHAAALTKGPALSSIKHTRSERASAILESPGTTLPPEIAASLLAAVDSDWNMLRYPQHLTFAGPAAIAIASGDPVKAELIAARTCDLATQRALYDLAEREDYERVLPALARSKNVSDHDLRIAIHDALLEQKRDLHAAVTLCPEAHIVNWLEMHEVPGDYPYYAAADVLCDSTDAVISRFLRHCETVMPEMGTPEYWSTPDRYQIERGMTRLGERLAKRGESERVVRLIVGLKRSVRFHILTAAWHHAETATAPLTRALLALVAENLDEVAERKAHANSNDRNEPWIPRLIKYRTNLGYDDESLRLLAKAAPAMIEPILAQLGNGDERRDLLIDLALESGEAYLVQPLLERRYSSDGSFNGPILRDGDDYHKAVSIMKTAPGRRIGNYGSARYIPKGAYIDDVLTATKDDGHARLYEALFEPRAAMRGAWKPNLDDFAKLIADTAPATLATAVYRGAESIRADIAGEYEKSYDGIIMVRKYLDIAIEHVKAERLCDAQDTLAYVATRLGEIFVDDPAGFDQALHLAATSTRTFGEVIRAAKKLR